MNGDPQRRCEGGGGGKVQISLYGFRTEPSLSQIYPWIYVRTVPIYDETAYGALHT